MKYADGFLGSTLLRSAWLSNISMKMVSYIET